MGHQQRNLDMKKGDVLEAGYTHEARNLASSDVKRRASHETSDGGYGDELHYPAKAK